MPYGFHVSVSDPGQFSAACEKAGAGIERIYVNTDTALSFEKKPELLWGTGLFLAAPYVLRNDDAALLEKLLDTGFFDGILVRDLQTLGFLNGNRDKYPGLLPVADVSLYVMNGEAVSFYREASGLPLSEVYVSTELTGFEAKELSVPLFEGGDPSGREDMILSSVIYGHLPVMVSANCVRKTEGNCTKKSGFTFIKDRMNKLLPVYHDCRFCCNIICNAVPLSLHGKKVELQKRGNARIDLTVETPKEAERILEFFLSGDPESVPPYSEYTTGHYRKGVE